MLDVLNCRHRCNPNTQQLRDQDYPWGLLWIREDESRLDYKSAVVTGKSETEGGNRGLVKGRENPNCGDWTRNR